MEALHVLRTAIYDHKWLRALLFPILKARNLFGSRRLAAQYRVLDRLSICLAEDPIVKVPEFPGRYAIGAQSHIFKRITMFGHYEPEMAEICRTHIDRNRDIVDVGANVGLYTVFFAQMAPTRQVLAIEPTAAALTRLKRNLVLNEVADRVKIFEGAASNHIGESQITVAPGFEEYSTLGAVPFRALGPEKTTIVPTMLTTVDTLVKLHGLNPGFVKVDVEGSEHLVIRGMRDVLRTHRPVVLAELCEPMLQQNGSSSHELVSMMKDLGYTVQTMPGEMLCLPR